MYDYPVANACAACRRFLPRQHVRIFWKSVPNGKKLWPQSWQRTLQGSSGIGSGSGIYSPKIIIRESEVVALTALTQHNRPIHAWSLSLYEFSARVFDSNLDNQALVERVSRVRVAAAP